MKLPKLYYEILPIRQKTSECLQTAVAQTLPYFKINKSVDQILREVSVSRDREGNKLGTSIGHMATYLLGLGINVKLHVFDVEIFDRSWAKYTNKQMITALHARQDHFKNAHYDKDSIKVIFDGYLSYLYNGGRIIIPQLSRNYLYQRLRDGPYIALLNSTYLNSRAKQSYVRATDTLESYDIQGRSGAFDVFLCKRGGNYTLRMHAANRKNERDVWRGSSF